MERGISLSKVLQVRFRGAVKGKRLHFSVALKFIKFGAVMQLLAAALFGSFYCSVSDSSGVLLMVASGQEGTAIKSFEFRKVTGWF